MSSTTYIAPVCKLKRDALGDSNYHDWKFAVSLALRKAGVWNIVTGKEKMPSDAAEKEKWETKAEEGLTLIGLTIEPSEYGHIRDAENGVVAWTALAAAHEKNTRATQISLRRQFYSFKHNPDTPVNDYITRITTLTSRLKSIKVDLKDIEIIDVLIFNLDESWGSIAGTLTAAPNKLMIADVTGALVDEEGRKGGPKVDESINTSLVARGTRSTAAEKCRNCRKPGHTKEKCWGKGGGKEGKIKCWKCKEEGHTLNKCPENKLRHNTSLYAYDYHSIDLAY